MGLLVLECCVLSVWALCTCAFSELTYTQLLQQYYLSRRGDVSALRHRKLR